MAFSFYLEFIGLSITSVWFLDLDRVQYIVHVLWTPLFVAVAKMSRQNILFIYIKCISRQLVFFFVSIRLEQQNGLIFFSRLHLARVLCKEYHVIE